MSAGKQKSREETGSSLPCAAEEVQDFYERYPYPRPVDSLEKYRELWLDPQRLRGGFFLSSEIGHFIYAGFARKERSQEFQHLICKNVRAAP